MVDLRAVRAAAPQCCIATITDGGCSLSTWARLRHNTTMPLQARLCTVGFAGIVVFGVSVLLSMPATPVPVRASDLFQFLIPPNFLSSFSR